MIKITCTSCQKPLSLDETKLPLREVSFPCPVCQAKLTVDRRTLPVEGAASPAQEIGGVAPAEHHDDDHHGYGSKALLIGNDHPALRQAIKLIGFLPVFVASAVEGREFYSQEFPQLVILNPGPLTAPPLESMQPIISLLPSDRRKSFFILFGENLRTLDGNAAFLYGVNLVVAPKDIQSFPQIFREAYAYHERLYAPMNSVLAAMHG